MGGPHYEQVRAQDGDHSGSDVECQGPESAPGCDQQQPQKQQQLQQPVPLWCWPVMAASVLAISGAAAVFRCMPEVPSITLAAWRLQLTSAVLLAGAAAQLPRMPRADRAAALGPDLPWSVLGGLALALHFGLWVFSLQATSLPHSLLLVCTTPVLLVLLALLRAQPVSRAEVGGSALAVAGAAALAAGAVRGIEAQVTLVGDAAAFGGACAMVAYLSAARRLRTYQPIFVYAFPVTALACLVLSTASFFLAEGRVLFAPGGRGVLGWATSHRYAGYVAYLGLGGGIVGHTGFNAVLKYLPSLTVALVLQLEPVIGPFIGWLLGVMEPPGPWTYVGGLMVLAATTLVITATARREASEAAAAAAAVRSRRRRRADWQQLAHVGPAAAAAAAAANGGDDAAGAVVQQLHGLSPQRRPVRQHAHDDLEAEEQLVLPPAHSPSPPGLRQGQQQGGEQAG